MLYSPNGKNPSDQTFDIANGSESLEYPKLPTGVEYIKDSEGKFTPQRIREHLDNFVNSVFSELISEYETTGQKIKIIIPLRGGIQIYWELMKKFRDNGKMNLLSRGNINFVFSAKQGVRPNKIYGIQDDEKEEDGFIYLVDDIYDSGESLELIQKNYPNREIRTRYATTKEGVPYSQEQNGGYEMMVYPFVWITNTFGMDSSFSTFYKKWQLEMDEPIHISKINDFMAELEALERLGVLPIQIGEGLRGYDVFQSWKRDPRNFEMYMDALRRYNYYLQQGKEGEFEDLKALYRVLIENEDKMEDALSHMMTQHINLSMRYMGVSAIQES